MNTSVDYQHYNHL